MSALLWFLSGLLAGLAIGGIFLLAFMRAVKRTWLPRLHPRQAEAFQNDQKIFGGGQRKRQQPDK